MSRKIVGVVRPCCTCGATYRPPTGSGQKGRHGYDVQTFCSLECAEGAGDGGEESEPRLATHSAMAQRARSFTQRAERDGWPSIVAAVREGQVVVSVDLAMPGAAALGAFLASSLRSPAMLAAMARAVGPMNRAGLPVSLSGATRRTSQNLARLRVETHPELRRQLVDKLRREVGEADEGEAPPVLSPANFANLRTRVQVLLEALNRRIKALEKEYSKVHLEFSKLVKTLQTTKNPLGKVARKHGMRKDELNLMLKASRMKLENLKFAVERVEGIKTTFPPKAPTAERIRRRLAGQAGEIASLEAWETAASFVVKPKFKSHEDENEEGGRGRGRRDVELDEEFDAGAGAPVRAKRPRSASPAQAKAAADDDEEEEALLNRDAIGTAGRKARLDFDKDRPLPYRN